MNTFFSSKGNQSSMRLMALICVVTACAIGLLAVILNRDLTGAGVLIGGILVPSFGGKWLQTKEELKERRYEENNTIR